MILPGGIGTRRRTLDGLGDAEHADRQRSQLHAGHGVTSPTGSLRGDLVEHLDLGEAHRVGRPAALGDDVGDSEAGDDEQQPQALRGEEVPAHRWTIAGRRRRRRTCAAISESQSPSVESSSQSPPDARTVCSRSRAAIGGAGRRTCAARRSVTITSRVAPVDGSAERDQADRWHVELAWIDDADGQQVVAHRQRRHRRRPVRAGEVGDDADEAASLAQRADSAQRLGKVAAAEALGVGANRQRPAGWHARCRGRAAAA